MVGKKRFSAVARLAPWIVSAAALTWLTPKLLASHLGNQARPAGSTVFEPWLLLTLAYLMCAAALSTWVLRGGNRGNSFVWLTAPLGALAIGVECVVIGPDHSSLVLYPSWPTLMALLMIVLSADALRRRNLPIDQLTIRMTVAASVMWFCGVAGSALPRLAGPWPIFIAENTACADADVGMFRVIATVTASGCLLSAVASRITRGHLIKLLPLGGMAAWFTSRAVIDVLGYRVARGICTESIAPNAISALSSTADIVGSAGLAICVACFSIAMVWETLRQPPQVQTKSWSVVALLPTLWLLTSPSLQPANSNAPTLTWAGGGDPPSYMVSSAELMTGVLQAGGELHIFQAGKRSRPANVDAITPPRRQRGGIALIVGEDATFGDLRSATSVLRHFSSIALVWRVNDLHNSSEASRRRWPFVEQASHALRAQKFHLIRENECPPRSYQRCRVDGHLVAVVNNPGALELAWWLRTRSNSPDPNATLVIPGFRASAPDWTAAEREPQHAALASVVPDATAGLAGLIVALFAALGFIARELLAARRFTPRAPPLRPTDETRPTWVSPELATLCAPSADRDPYRGAGHGQVQLATAAVSMRELRRVIGEALHEMSVGTVCWVFMAVIATALGVGLRLISF